MRKLVLFVVLAIAAPHAHAGEFTPRASKEPTTAAPVAKAKPKARTVAKRTWRPAAKPKKAKKLAVEKRPLP